MQVGRFSYGFEEALQEFAPDDTKSVLVGDFCSAAPGAKLIPGGRHFVGVSTFPLSTYLHGRYHPLDAQVKGSIVIGPNTWIASNAVILSGVSLGPGCIVGAGSVVTKSFGPFCTIAGNPARLIEQRLTDEQRMALLEIAWWDWPETKIRKYEYDFYGSVDEFITKHRVQR